MNPWNDVWRFFKGRRDIGKRTNRAQCNGAFGFSAQRFNNEVNAMLCLKRHFGVVQLWTIQPGFAMDMFSSYQFAVHRCCAASENQRVRLASQFTHDPRVLFSQWERYIARHRGDPQNVNFLRRRERQKDRNRVVLAGVSVDDDFARCHVGFPVVFPPQSVPCTWQGQGGKRQLSQVVLRSQSRHWGGSAKHCHLYLN